MTASRVIYEGPDSRMVLVVIGLLGIAGVFMLYTIAGWVSDRRKRSHLLDAQLQRAEADAAAAGAQQRRAEADAAAAEAAVIKAPRGRHSGPQQAIPWHVPQDWADEHARGYGEEES